MSLFDKVANFFTGNQKSDESEQPELTVTEQQNEMFRQAVAALQATPRPITDEQIERARQLDASTGYYDND